MKNRVTQVFVLWCTLMLLISGYTNNTLSWLFNMSNSIVNTFTYGDINIELSETDDGDNDLLNNLYEMIPDTSIDKDPIVTVLKDSEACYLYVEVKESNNFDSFMTYQIEDGWILLDGYQDVYYREVSEENVKDSDMQYAVIKGNKVYVKSEVTKQQLEVLTEQTYPTLKIKAYAVQKASMGSAVEAWNVITK